MQIKKVILWLFFMLNDFSKNADATSAFLLTHVIFFQHFLRCALANPKTYVILSESKRIIH